MKSCTLFEILPNLMLLAKDFEIICRKIFAQMFENNKILAFSVIFYSFHS
jgi:hypothetical protein